MFDAEETVNVAGVGDGTGTCATGKLGDLEFRAIIKQKHPAAVRAGVKRSRERRGEGNGKWW